MTASHPTSELSDTELAILDMESRRFKYQGAKERAIRQELNVGVTSYYQQLNQLISSPAAWALKPHLMRRLQNKRDGLPVEELT